MSATSSTVLTRARGQLGYNGTGTTSAPHTKFNVWFYGRDLAAQWCAIFASWALVSAGVPFSVETARGFAYCPSGVAWFQRNKRWFPATSTPQPGDLVFFSYGRVRADHVGIVESYDAKTGRITSIQGNTTDAAAGRTGNCLRRKVHTRAYVLGFGRPPYAAPSAPKPTAPAAVSHVVARGETLGKIAAKYKTTVVAIARLNPSIKNVNVISVGQRIRVR